MKQEAERLLDATDAILDWARRDGRDLTRPGWVELQNAQAGLRQALKALADTPGKVRRGGHATERKAAKTVRTGTVRAEVLDALRAAPKGLTHHELLDELRKLNPTRAESTIRTRCAELVEMGLARDSGKTRPSPGGNDAIVWEPT